MENLSDYVFFVTPIVLSHKGTVSKIEGNGFKSCYILEDVIRVVKIMHDTCISAGRYEVILKYSNRYKRLMPFLLNVPNFQGIMIHTGNTTKDTSGCLLIGEKFNFSTFSISESRIAYNRFFVFLVDKISVGRVFIDITR